ncbi:ligand-binding sensor domain-containing protein [Deferrisoma palaeochoriense]
MATEAGEVRTAPARPVLEPPPELPARSAEERWEEARRRAKRLEPRIREDIARVSPPPVPEEVLSPPVPKQKPAAKAPAPSPAAKAPEEKPASAEPVPAPQEVGRASVPDVRVTQRYTTENGLPSNRITALYVDETDAWVGTADAGVARLNFEEGNWIVTKVEDGLASNRVTDIAKYKGVVYVGTDAGISVWDGASWQIKDTEGRVKLVNARFRVHDGLLWVAARTMHGGLLTFDGERWKDRGTMKPGTVLNNVSDFDFAGDTLWIGTTNRGVYRFDGKGWTTFTVADGIASNFVYTLAVKGATCYLGGCCGVSVYENGSWRIYDIAEGLPHSTVNAIAVDGDLVWFGSKKGLGLFDGFQFTNFYTEDGLTDDRITALFVRGTEVWVGTANGLNRLEKSY